MEHSSAWLAAAREGASGYFSLIDQKMGRAEEPGVLFNRVTATRSQNGSAYSRLWIMPKCSASRGGNGRVEIPFFDFLCLRGSNDVLDVVTACRT